MTREPSINVLGEALQSCSETPLTGFFRDGCCNTGDEDAGSHTVCAQVTADFLEFSRDRLTSLARSRMFADPSRLVRERRDAIDAHAIRLRRLAGVVVERSGAPA